MTRRISGGGKQFDGYCPGRRGDDDVQVADDRLRIGIGPPIGDDYLGPATRSLSSS
jgi:hypothetical protein